MKKHIIVVNLSLLFLLGQISLFALANETVSVADKPLRPKLNAALSKSEAVWQNAIDGAVAIMNVAMSDNFFNVVIIESL